MNWLFFKSKSGGALNSDIVDDKAVDKSEFTRLKLHDLGGGRVASGKVLDALNAELRARRIKAIARDFETRINSFAETEAECVRLGLSVDDIIEFFGTRFSGAGDWRAKHSAQLMDSLRNRRDRVW